MPGWGSNITIYSLSAKRATLSYVVSSANHTKVPYCDDAHISILRDSGVNSIKCTITLIASTACGLEGSEKVPKRKKCSKHLDKIAIMPFTIYRIEKG